MVTICLGFSFVCRVGIRLSSSINNVQQTVVTTYNIIQIEYQIKESVFREIKVAAINTLLK